MKQIYFNFKDFYMLDNVIEKKKRQKISTKLTLFF